MIDQEQMEAVKKELEKNNLKIINENENKLGEGTYGTVFEVQDTHNPKKTYAAKIIIGDKNKEKYVKDFRGVNIIKINKEIPIEKKDIYITIMELSTFGDLRKLYFRIDKTENGNKENKSFLNIEKNKKILKEPFLENFGDNLTRFFAKQLVTALKTFNQGNIVHFDIKPLNILLFPNLEIKLIDFGLLKKLDDSKTKKYISGGTPGYVTPEYYYNYKSKEPMDDESLKKQDYFAVGATIFFLKYGKKMLSYNGYPMRKENIENKTSYSRQKQETKAQEEKINPNIQVKSAKELTGDVIIFSLENVMNFIKMQKYQDKDFDEFLCKLIQFKPEDRPDFEHIIRNKWLNKNSEELDIISKINISDESNLILELQKSDFLINKKRNYRKVFDEKNKLDDIKYVNNKKGKFKFVKKKLNKK